MEQLAAVNERREKSGKELMKGMSTNEETVQSMICSIDVLVFIYY